MVKFLLDKVKLHYKGNIPDRIKQAASAAAGGGHLEVLKLLVGDESFDKMDNRSELSSGLLVPAASTGRADMIRSILQMNPEPDFKDRLSAACQANKIKNFEIPQLLPATNKMPTIEVYPISTMLVQPAREGLIDYVRLLLANGARADYSSARVDFDGPQLTPLQAAASGGHLDICILLLDNEAAVDDRADSEGGRTAPQAGAEGGHVELVGLLLNHQADVSAPKAKKDGITALEAAVKSGSTTIAKMLLERRAHARGDILYQGNPLADAARVGHLHLVKLLLDYHANVNGTYTGQPPLYSAAESGHINVVRFLLDYGAGCPPPPGREWLEALSLAASSGHIELVKLLCEIKCDYSSFTVRSMMEAAARRGHLDTVRFLLQNAPDSAFETGTRDDLRKILQIACCTAQADLVQLVWESMKRNNTICAADLLESSALRQAAERGHIHIVKLLLSYGADPTLGDKDGKVALQAAAGNGDLEMIETLLLPNRLYHIHEALHAAVQNGNIDIVRRLLNLDRNINVNTPVYGEYLLRLAVGSAEMDIVKLLLDRGADVNAGSEEALFHRSGSNVLKDALFSRHVDIIKLIVCQKSLIRLLPENYR